MHSSNVRVALASSLLVGIAPMLLGQSLSGIPAVDSANVAREAWHRATVALDAKDVAGARREVDRAAMAWPAQPAYVWGRAVMAQLSEDTTETRSALAAYAALGLGKIERRWDFPPAPLGHVLGDLAIGPSGDVFMTDSNDPVLYRLRPGADTLEKITSPLFRSLQGMAPLPNGKVVYVADYSHGLLRVDLRTKDVTRLADAPGSTSIGCDGIAWDGAAIVAVQNGVTPARVMRFVVDDARRRVVRADVLDRNIAIADEPTIGAIVGREFVYVANSQWEKYTDQGVRRPERPLTRPTLLAVPLLP